MRINSSLILLASVAVLALSVQAADQQSPLGNNNNNSNHAASTEPQKDQKQNTAITADAEAAIAVPPTNEKVQEIGKGIVMTRHSFFVHDPSADPTDAHSNTNSISGTYNRAVALAQKPLGLLDNLLGINIDIGGGGEDKKKKKKDQKGGKDGGNGDEDDDGASKGGEDRPLYGDDGYVPRPVPKGCDTLEFEDQMIWDQQVGASSRPASESQAEPADAPDAAASTSGTAEVTGEDVHKDVNSKKELEDLQETDSKKQKAVDPSKSQSAAGIHICLLGGCDKDDPEEDDDDSKHPRDKKDRGGGKGKGGSRGKKHKQEKFLSKYRGKALKVDSKTGCPLPSS